MSVGAFPFLNFKSYVFSEFVLASKYSCLVPKFELNQAEIFSINV